MKIERSITKLILPLLGIAMGTWLIVTGIQMVEATVVQEIRNVDTVPGTKGRNSAIGAGAGAVVGGGAAAAVGGGVGIALMGTGVGIPFGALILLGVGVGAGSGALAGAATGKSATEDVTITIIHNPLYGPFEWGVVIAAGVVLVVISVVYMRHLKKVDPNDILTDRLGQQIGRGTE